MRLEQAGHLAANPVALALRSASNSSVVPFRNRKGGRQATY